jgi:hypothetical protein
MAKAALIKEKVLFTRRMDLNLRKKIIQWYIWSIVVYGTEIWALRKMHLK